MSYLLFMDESGHDHKQLPYEVRGGVILHASKLWRFVQQMRANEVFCFGDYLHKHGTELKGSKLLRKKSFKFARQADWLPDGTRQDLSRRFLRKTAGGDVARREEFTAFGQACLLMARRIFETLSDCDAKLIASAIPPVPAPPDVPAYLRKDHVFLFERYFYFLEEHDDTGLIVLDETEKHADRAFVRRLEAYFDNTAKGLQRRTRVVPAPLFVSSDLSYPVQAADVVIYCINWGFRLPNGMNKPVRQELADDFEWRLRNLQYRCYQERNGKKFHSYGIVFVPDPYEARK